MWFLILQKKDIVWSVHQLCLPFLTEGFGLNEMAFPKAKRSCASLKIVSSKFSLDVYDQWGAKVMSLGVMQVVE